MAKRFTDTEIWEEDWFIALPKDIKLFWNFLKDSCDHAGIWKPNITKFNMLYRCRIEPDEAIILLNVKKDRVIILPSGRWFLPGFIPFQYGHTLNTANRMHRSILGLININEIDLRSIRPQLEVIDTPKDKDKDKDKDKVISNTTFRFDDVWMKYPKRIGKKEAAKHFNASVKTEKDFKDINIAIDAYKKSKTVTDGYVQNGATWFNNWRDWVVNPESKPDEVKKFRPDCFMCKGSGKMGGGSECSCWR